MKIQFAVPGPPQGKARPRFGKGRTYTPDNTVLYEKIVQVRYRAQAKGIPLLVGPLSVEIWAFYPIPKRTSKVKREKMCDMELRPTKKPDLDNVAKIVCDALNGVAYKDDSQIVDLKVHKYFSETPEVAVVIMADE